MRFKENLLTARDWSTLCRGPTARSGSATRALDVSLGKATPDERSLIEGANALAAYGLTS